MGIGETRLADRHNERMDEQREQDDNGKHRYTCEWLTYEMVQSADERNRRRFGMGVHEARIC